MSWIEQKEREREQNNTWNKKKNCGKKKAANEAFANLKSNTQ